MSAFVVAQGIFSDFAQKKRDTSYDIRLAYLSLRSWNATHSQILHQKCTNLMKFSQNIYDNFRTKSVSLSASLASLLSQHGWTSRRRMTSEHKTFMPTPMPTSTFASVAVSVFAIPCSLPAWDSLYWLPRNWLLGDWLLCDWFIL